MRKPKGEAIGDHWKLSSCPTLSKEIRLGEFNYVCEYHLHVFVLY